eukprot:9777445-Alexandrium_andersonii.AAC.1
MAKTAQGKNTRKKLAVSVNGKVAGEAGGLGGERGLRGDLRRGGGHAPQVGLGREEVRGEVG